MPQTTSALLDRSHVKAHKTRNLLHSMLLIGGIGALAAFSAWLVWGGAGILAALISTAIALFFGMRVSPKVVMRMFRAQPLDPVRGGDLYKLVELLSARAQLPAVPDLYVVPSATLNAFAVGRPDESSVAVTEGLLKTLDMPELAGVLAHEISHIRNNDLWIMGLADVMSRFTQMMSSVGLAFLAVNLLLLYLGKPVVLPWAVAGLLYIAPMIGSLLQLALSRAREFDADLEGAELIGDPKLLATALEKLEHYQGKMWEDMFPAGRRIPIPSVLRSHPTTQDRVARLNNLRRKMPPKIILPGNRRTVYGFVDHTPKPRYRRTGVWY